MTVLQALKSISVYPLPLRTLEEAAERRGLDLTADATQAILSSAAYNLAMADVLVWLVGAPDVSQGGQSYSFTDEQRTRMLSRANALLAKYATDADAETSTGVVYGYKGNRL